MARKPKAAQVAEAGNKPREPEPPSAGLGFAGWSEARIIELERMAAEVARVDHVLDEAARTDRILAALVPARPGIEREVASELVARLDAAGNPDPELRARLVALFDAAPLGPPVPARSSARKPAEPPSLPEGKQWTPAELARLLATWERFNGDGKEMPTKRTAEWAAARFGREKYSESFIRRKLREAKRQRPLATREAHSQWVGPKQGKR